MIAGASKQHKKMPQKVFHGNINVKALGYFNTWFVCVLLGFFPEFPVNPYYEPLALFIIESANIHYMHLLSKLIMYSASIFTSMPASPTVNPVQRRLQAIYSTL